jgi:ferritin-like metal-binding protein YciE
VAGRHDGPGLRPPGLSGPPGGAAIIAAARRAEPYEIAAYGTAAAWAEALGLSEVADLLGQTLEE